MNMKRHRQKIKKPFIDIIQGLVKDTETDDKSLCEQFGVDDLKDLYADEAGKITDLLVLKKTKMEKVEEDEANKKD